MAIFFAACAGAHAQVAPAATGPGLPVSGNLNYSLRYSQTAEFGAALGDWQTSDASASVGYANSNTRLPFKLNYGGGYTWTLAGPTYSTGLFQNLLLSQGIVWRKWSVVASDDVSYRPQAPTIGFSGIPGTGEPIGGSGTGTPSSQSILTVNTHTVDNLANGELEHILNYATTLSAGGDSELLRYPDGNGLDTDTQRANAGLTRRLNARNSLSGQYMFSRYSYPGSSLTFETNSGFLHFKREWNRKITTDVSIGPQWVSSSDSAIMPSSTKVAVNAAVNYQFRFTSASLSYNRGANGGAGYMLGSESNNVSANFSREFGRDLTIGITGSYMRSSGLQNTGLQHSGVTNAYNGVINAKYGGAQATRKLGRYLTVFASYSAIDQSSSSSLPINVLNQLEQVIGFGIGYSPRETRLGQ
jgi:hypothetical protein